MADESDEALSRRLSYVLRHRPDTLGLTLDAAGWVDVERLLQALCAQGTQVARSDLERLIQAATKPRFGFSPDGQRIRASQGHSRPVELGYTPRTPPAVLYHGTVERFLASIARSGLERRQRHHVHLSATREAASAVGARRGRPLVLQIDAQGMHAAGHAFFEAENGVWLTLHVPPAFLVLPSRADTSE